MMTSFNCNHLFALQPQKGGHITLYDVRDAYQIAKYMRRRTDRETYYTSLGMDIDLVEKTYPQLEKLEASWTKSKYPTRHWCFELGSFRIDITRLE